MHAKELERAWVDKIINYQRWKVYTTRLTNEWSNVTFYVCRFSLLCISEKC